MRRTIRPYRTTILATGMATVLAASGALAQQQNPEAQAGQWLDQQMQQEMQRQPGQQGEMSRHHRQTGTDAAQQSQSQDGQQTDARSGQSGGQPVIIVETDDGYYLVRPRQGRGLVREFRAIGPSDQRPQRAEVNLEEFGREMWLRGYRHGRSEAREAYQAALEQADQGQSQAQDQPGQDQPGQWRQGSQSHGQVEMRARQQFGSTMDDPGRQPMGGRVLLGETQQGQQQGQQQGGQVENLVQQARSAVQNDDLSQAETSLNRLDQMVGDDRQKLQQAIEKASQAVADGDAQAAQNALDEARSALQGQS